MVRAVDRTILLCKGAACIGMGLLATVPAGVAAQEVRLSGSAGDGSASDYGQEPIRVGGFEVYPSIEAEVDFNDNVFASSSNEREDVIVSVNPTITARDRRPDRELFFRGRAGLETFLDGTTDTRTFGSVAGRAHFGLGTLTRPSVGFEIRHNSAQRRSDEEGFRSIAQPIEVTTIRGNAALQRDFGPVTAEIGARANRTRFDGSLVIGDLEYDVSFRDYDAYSGHMQLSYARSENQRVFVSIEANEQRFDAPSPDSGLPEVLILDRSSQGYRAEFGFARQVTDLLVLEGRIGYLHQSYDDPAIEPTSGLSFQASVLYDPTRLTSLRLTALRAIDNTSNPFLAGLVRTEFSGQVEHELLRNLILAADLRYASINRDEALDDIDEWNAGASLEYFLDRHWSASANLEHAEGSGSYRYSQNRLIFGLRYRY